MKSSLVILTYNRAETVMKTVAHNLDNAGKRIDELIWVDNGSCNDDLSKLYQFFEGRADVKILNKENLGVAKGYNRGIVLATGDLIAITGCDRLMPGRWLNLTYFFDFIPETGVISVYSKPHSECPERFPNNSAMEEDRGEHSVIPCMPMEAKIFRRSLLKDVGHLREDFGLYGYEDVEWGYRMQRVLREKNMISYTIPKFIAEHLGSEGSATFNGKDNSEYHSFKQAEVNDEKKVELMQWCRANEFPFYTPYL